MKNHFSHALGNMHMISHKLKMKIFYKTFHIATSMMKYGKE